mgnify:CR=1 FL=1
MPIKLKPSSKQYIKDANGRMTQKWKWNHYTVGGTSTEELKKLYNSDSYKRKKELIRKELVKRGAWENLKKK